MLQFSHHSGQLHSSVFSSVIVVEVLSSVVAVLVVRLLAYRY